ncbi:hypothetical protein OH77DRAFT_745288 [Trametes cingulata]|nr:hypothetical protein OH77DRAFT_745288 [Trametes cingulata]
MQLPPLPAGVLQRIFDSIGDNTSNPDSLPSTYRRTGLKSWCHVCKAWRPVAQSVLYREVNIDVNSLRRARFLVFLNENPSIAVHIRKLSIARDGTDFARPAFPIYPSFLLKLFAALPKLRELGLFHVVLGGWPRFVPLPTTHWVKLDTLTLVNPGFTLNNGTERRRLFDFLKLFEVDKLSIAGDQRRELPGLVTHVFYGHAPLPAVRELDLYGGSPLLTITEWMGGLDPQRLCSVRLEPIRPKHLLYMGHLLRRYGRSIRSLGLYAGQVLAQRHSDKSFSMDVWKSIDLGACPHLRSLRLYWAYGWRGNWSSEQDALYSEVYQDILSRTSASATLHELDIVVLLSGDPPTAFDSMPANLAPVIEHALEKHCHLHRITVEISECLDLEKALEIMRGVLPQSVMDSSLLHFKANYESC